MSRDSKLLPGVLTESRTVRCILILLSLLFIGIFLILPLLTVFKYALDKGFDAYLGALSSPDTLSAVKLTLITVLVSIPVNLFCGIFVAWLLSRFQFPGKNLLISLIDLPMAISPVVVGMMFVLVYGMHGWFGEFLSAHDLKVIFAVPGIILVTTFVTSPLIAREILSVMEEKGLDQELAALTMGANGIRVFLDVTLPNIKWALLYGVILCNARAIGEFGAVSVVSGHIRGSTNTLPLHIEILYNEYNFVGAFAVSSILTILALFTIVLKSFIEMCASKDV